MPVEFRCPSCSKLLRTPDESAGKKAKCPQCGAIVDVPAEDRAAGVPQQPVQEKVFADTRRSAGDYPPSPSAAGVHNPYAAPRVSDTPFYATTSLGELHHTQVNVDGVLATTWKIFAEQLGPLALAGLVLFGVNFALQLFGQIGGAVAQASNEIAVIVAFTVVNMLISIVVQTWLQLGAINYSLKVARERNAKLGDLIDVGNFVLRGIGLSIVIGLIIFGVLLLCAIPALLLIATQNQPLIVVAAVIGVCAYVPIAVVLLLRYSLAFPFLVDRRAGILQALSLSAQYMRQNKLTALLVFLVTSVAGGLFTCLTCFVGYILYLPFWNLLVTILYLSVTGQQFMQPVKRTTE